MIPVWLEVHVDAAALDRALPWRRRARWEPLAAALDDIAHRAERHGARLSFRVRERPARLDPAFFRTLARRGHEVGWHAHGDRLHAARDAVVAAGGTATVATPGFVQVPDWRRLAGEARDLGATLVTDRIEAPVVQYQGVLAWEPVPGLTSMDVTVSPFAWGVLRREGRKIVPGRLDVPALRRLLTSRERFGVPTGATGFFGATFHDHDVLDATVRAELEGLFAALGSRVVRSGDVVRGAGGQAPPQRPPRVRELWGRAGLLRRAHLLRLRVERHGTPATDTTLMANGATFAVRRVGPAQPDAVVVLVHGGGSGVRQGLAPFGMSEAALAEAGLAAWSFARSEGEAPPGSARTVAEAEAVLRAALAEGRPVVLLTWSSGVVPALRAALAVNDPRVVALLDVEGPADRFSLVPPGSVGHALAALDPWDDAAWAGREAEVYIRQFPGRYVRVQAEDDHVHGPHAWHAARMVEAARHGRLNDDGSLLPGRVAAHGDRILAWLREAALGPRPAGG